MIEVLGFLLLLCALSLFFQFLFWLFILLPADMAKERRRDAFVWVCISIVGSPLLAILLLVALGYAPDSEEGR